MESIKKMSILLIMIASHTSWNMFRILRTSSSKKQIRNCSSVYTPQTFDERLRRGVDYFLACEMIKRNKKLRETLQKQSDVIEEYKKNEYQSSWWVKEEYTDKLYWLEKELQMIAQDKN